MKIGALTATLVGINDLSSPSGPHALGQTLPYSVFCWFTL
jgi:hypothetical protein